MMTMRKKRASIILIHLQIQQMLIIFKMVSLKSFRFKNRQMNRAARRDKLTPMIKNLKHLQRRSLPAKETRRLQRNSKDQLLKRINHMLFRLP